MAHTRFFNYAEQAPAEYKQKLENAVKNFDNANDGSKYTPKVAHLLCLIIGGLVILFNKLSHANEDSDYDNINTILGSSLVVINACAAFIMYVCNQVADTAKKDSGKLITIGINNGFFKTNPDLSDIDDDEKKQMFHDVQMLSVLQPKREGRIEGEGHLLLKRMDRV